MAGIHRSSQPPVDSKSALSVLAACLLIQALARLTSTVTMNKAAAANNLSATTASECFSQPKKVGYSVLSFKAQI
jgi:hypothetical protein